MTPAGARLDRFLARTVAELRASKTMELNKMPETGGKRLAGNLRGALADLRKQTEDMHVEVAAAVTELQTEIGKGHQVSRQLREEAAEVRGAFGEILGNEPESSVPEDPQKYG